MHANPIWRCAGFLLRAGNDEDEMTQKFPAASKLVVLLAAAALVAVGATSASAQSKPRYDKDGRPYYGATGPNRSYQQGPHTRVYVTTRSWLDAGTEVLPGERKFTDYAFPVGPYSMPMSVVQSTGGRVGWHQSPLPGPFDLPSRYNPYGW